MERDCESELSKLNIEQNACIYHFGASVIHGQRSNILRLQKISQLQKGQEITIKYFTDGYYEDIAGVLDTVDAINKELRVYTGFINDTGKELPTIIAFEDILEIGVNMT